MSKPLPKDDNSLQTERRKPGPPPLVEAEAKEMACRCLAIGLSRTETATELGFSKATLCRAIQQDPKFKERVLQAEATYQRHRTLRLLKSAERSWRLGVWMYQHYHPHRSTRQEQLRDQARQAAEAQDAVRAALDRRERSA